MPAVGNLLASLPDAGAGEQVTPLIETANLRLERIVSHAHASPEGFWYDQDRAEWVMVLQGTAGLQFEGEDAARVLRSGDFVQIPAHVRHRVAWTDPAGPTVWLALHYD